MDFSNCVKSYRFYENGTEQKFGIELDGDFYMLKFPKDLKEREDVLISYANNVISEYLGCKIFNSVGMNSQETILGKYENKTVVACKDFNQNGYRLVEFRGFKLGIIHGSSSDGSNTELSEIMETIDSHDLIADKDTVKNYFWKMFIIDALIGNFDRHNGNWGLMVNEESKDIVPAPVYDCGSCLYPRLTDEQMKAIISDTCEIDKRIYEFPRSAIKENQEKIDYFEFISSMKNDDCNHALKEMFPKIDLDKINLIIECTPYICDIRKTFYKTMIFERYTKILAHVYEMLKA
jgi:hypothetical protein